MKVEDPVSALRESPSCLSPVCAPNPVNSFCKLGKHKSYRLGRYSQGPGSRVYVLVTKQPPQSGTFLDEVLPPLPTLKQCHSTNHAGRLAGKEHADWCREGRQRGVFNIWESNQKGLRAPGRMMNNSLGHTQIRCKKKSLSLKARNREWGH